MILKAENITADKLISITAFVKELRIKTGNNKISNSTIHYHMEHTDNLDYVMVYNKPYIVKNKKSNIFKPGNYYGKRTMSKISL